MSFIYFLFGLSFQAASQFIEKNGHLTQVEEDVMLALISYITGKVLAYAAVPVWSVVLIEECLDVFTYILFTLLSLINGLVNLLFDICLHVGVHFADNPGDVSFSHFDFKNIFKFIINLKNEEIKL